MKFNTEKFKEMVKDKGWTISIAAKKIRVTDRTIYLWLEKTYLPSNTSIDRMCELFKCEYQDLIT